MGKKSRLKAQRREKNAVLVKDYKVEPPKQDTA